MLAQPPNSAASALLRFPVKIRNNIYKEVLVVAHPIYLFQDPGCPVETFAPDRPRRWLSLLHVNRQVRSEASVILYGMNHFTLLRTPREPAGLLQAFLDCIGPSNASLLSHISINFPVLEGQPEEERRGGGGGGAGVAARLREDSLQDLKLLQQRCTSLKTLENHLYGKASKSLSEAHKDNPVFSQEALFQIDIQLKAIPSLEKVIVRVYDGTLSSSTKRTMLDFNWVVLPWDKDQHAAI